jgi:hypothetical protein
LSVSPVPRREITGVFPPHESPWIGTAIAAPKGEEERKRVAAAALDTPGWEAARQSIATAVRPNSGAAASPTTGSQTAIGKLLEQTRKPVPMPGLEIRLVRPHEHEAGEPRRKAEERERVAPAPLPPPAPQLDINAVADRVYQTLVRRQQFERERKGLY